MRPHGTYCSLLCKNRAHSQRMAGRVQPSYRLNSTFRKAIRQCFHDRCSLCGWSETPCDVAHIIASKDGGTDTLDNVTMLCPNHHRMFDLGLITAETIKAVRVTVLKHQ